MDKVKVLLLAADPIDTPRLPLGELVREISEKMRAAEYRDAVELVPRWAVRPDDVQQALLELRPHVVHFCAHGTPAEQLLLTGKSGRSEAVDKTFLVPLLRTLRDNIKVVVFNACWGRPLAADVAEAVGCAVGVSGPVTGTAAIAFSASFYRALGFGRSVAEAFELGKVALTSAGVPGDQTPELLTGPGVDAAGLRLIEPPAPRPTGPPPSMDRLTLVRTLAALSPADFELLVAAIPNAAQRVGRQGTIPEKAAELVRWAESPPGCGLRAVEEMLAGF
jgi:hypothetical protein